jgi:flagellar FliJ protein
MSWADSLIKLSGYEVETLQKRLSEIVDRRTQAEMQIVLIEAEAEAEAAHARHDAEAGWYQVGFLEGVRIRKAQAQIEIDRIALEEAGARDALAAAFEDQKKYEQVAENMRLARNKEVAKQETAALDELGLRRAGGGAGW